MNRPSKMPRPKTQAERIYATARWKRMSKLVRKQEPVCCDPLGVHSKESRFEPTEHVDHIIPISKDASLAFVRDNLRGVCARCNQLLRINPNQIK